MSVEMILCKLNGQFDIVLPKHRADRPEWYTEKGWEKKRLEHMHSQIKKGDLVFYIGGEECDMCGLVASWGAELVIFEPNPKVWSNAKAIWEANNFATPYTIQAFASNETKIIDEDNSFKLGFPACADNEIDSAHGFKELNKEADTYNQMKIDDLTKMFKPPDCISLDVEGSEGHVLRGAEQTLRKYHPTIFLSLHPEMILNEYGEWGAELRKWLIDMGYKETLIDYPLHEVHLYYE